MTAAVPMSLQRNIVASFASQIYVALIGILMVPTYIKYMGPEAYGLVGFFAMLQALFNLLDIGMTPTIARETARQRGGASDALSYRRLVRALELVFLVVGLVGASAMLFASGYIARDWLQVSQLAAEEVVTAVRLMAVIIAMRWMAGLYRGSIGGAERQVWLGGFNAAIATLRFSGVLPLLMFVGATPTHFFGFQLIVAVIELVLLYIHARRLLPTVPAGAQIPWSWAPLKPVLKFSLTIAFTSSVWVFVTQSDKLVLSRILPLAEYGYFTLAVLVASGIMIISSPIGNAIMPRMARLEALGEHEQMIRVYRQATQLVAVLAGAVSITMAFNAESLLWAWTGNNELAHEAAPVLALYALGNGVLAVSAFPYYLQFAKGDLRLHLVGNAGFVGLLVPLMIWAASRYGDVGAGFVWLGMNLVTFLVWLPVVHSRLEPSLNPRWHTNDVVVIAAAMVIVAYILSHTFSISGGRLTQFAQLVLTGFAILVAGIFASSAVRAKCVARWG